MKKLLLIPFLALFAVSCSEDDSAPGNMTGEPSIVGKWMVVDKDRPTGEDFPLWECEENSYIKFNEDGTFLRMKYHGVDENCVPQNMTDTNMAYTLNGSTLTMTYDDVSVGATTDPAVILELTNTTLKMEVNFSDDDQGSVIFTFSKATD